MIMPRGYSTSGDVIRVSADGVDLARVWDELQGTLEVWNAERDSLAALVTAPVTVPAEAVPQGTTLGDFEEASEFGVPVSIRTQPALSTLGFTLRWYDTAARFTWRFLLDAPVSQVQAVHSGILEADNRLTFTKLMGALFNNTRRANENGTPVMPLWAGAADDIPPPVLGAAFPAGHQHYLTSGSLAIDGTDVADLVRHVSHHGYGVAPGSRLIVFANPAQADVIRGFRKADGAPFDYVPGSATPAYLTDVAIVGEQAPASFEGQAIAGSFPLA
jgi:hypothetical protein